MYPQTLDNSEVLKGICVSPPYFAFDHVVRHGSAEVSGGVNAQTAATREPAPISGAEAGRHLAILGTVAASLANPKPGRHYYLARRALLVRLDDGRVTRPAGLTAQAEAHFEDRRVARAQGTLSADGEAVYSLDVRYDVLPEPTFLRIFGAHRRWTGGSGRSGPSAYATAPPLDVLEPDATAWAAELSSVTAEHCPGHFEDHPALPVAVVMGVLSGLAADCLAGRLQRPSLQVQVMRAEVVAHALAFAGERVRFEARSTPLEEGAGVENTGLSGFRCVAAGSRGRVGEMGLVLRTL